MKKYNPIKCEVCKEDFTPRSGRTLYCDKCRPIVKKMRDSEKNKLLMSMRRKTKHKKKPVMSWNEVIRVCEENRCSYGEAVVRGLLK